MYNTCRKEHSALSEPQIIVLMNPQTVIKLYNYIRKRLRGNNDSIFLEKELPRTMTWPRGSREHIYFNLEPKLEQALAILILDYGRYLHNEKRLRIYQLFKGSEFTHIDRLRDPQTCMAEAIIVRRPYHWRIKKHHYLAKKGPEGYAKDAIKRLRYVVKGFHDLIVTLKCIEKERL